MSHEAIELGLVPIFGEAAAGPKDPEASDKTYSAGITNPPITAVANHPEVTKGNLMAELQLAIGGENG
jgi:hypothetical protein